MRTKLRSKVTLLFMAFALLLAVPAIALADQITGDGDDVTTGTQGTVELGTVAPGAEITKTASFKLECTTRNHIERGETLSLNFSSTNSKVFNTDDTAAASGSVGAVTTNTADTAKVRFPTIPSTWPLDDASCPSTPPTLAATDTADVAITAPDDPGTYYAVARFDHSQSDEQNNDITGNNTSIRYNLTVEEQNQAPTAEANGPYSVNEGSSTTLSSLGSIDSDGSIVSYAWKFDNNDAGNDGDLYDDATGASPSFSAANLDGPSSLTIGLRVTDDDGATGTDTATVNVLNVKPDITNISASSQVALAGLANKVTFSGTADDPSNADDLAGFSWKWSFDNFTTVSGTTNPFQASFTQCGSYDVSATATDKDGAESDAEKLSDFSSAVSVYNANFQAPLKDGSVNMVQKGQVVPVKISIGCASALTGLQPHIQLLNGNVSPESESGSTTVTTTSAQADTTQIMRPVDGGYIYNLQVPSNATANQEFTVRVNPFGASANNAATGMYTVLKIRK